MIMTILEAHVAEEKWATLEATYKEGTTQLPPKMSQTFLVRGATDPSLWRIVTVWDMTQEGLQEMRRQGTPGGVLMFREAGAEPHLSVYEVSAHASF